MSHSVPAWRKLGNAKLAVLLACCALWMPASALGATFTNPIISDGADP